MAGGASVVLGSLTMFAGVLTLSGAQRIFSLGLVLAGIVMAIVGFTFACSSIRCPACGARWLWLAVKEQRTGSWLAWLMSQTQCPICKRT